VLTDDAYRDGMLDVSTTYEYDEDGNVVVERATDGEAALLSQKQYEYGAGSRLTQLTVDDNGDGIDDVVTRWTYDSEGRLLTVEERRGADPEAPFVVTEGYTYDAEGRLIETTLDSDADGTPDGFERRRYEC
jgi:YD repeat-containing protein